MHSYALVNSLSRVLGTVAMLIALGAGAMTAGMAFQKCRYYDRLLTYMMS